MTAVSGTAAAYPAEALPAAAVHSRAAWKSAAAGSFRRHLPLAVFALLYALVAIAVAAGLGHPAGSDILSLDILEFLGWMLIEVFAIAFSARVLYVMLRLRPRRLVRFLWQDMALGWAAPERVANLVPVLALLPVIVASAGVLKPLIPFMHPYDWDPAFAALDRRLHFGVDPWRLLQPLLGHPYVTTLMSAAYQLWLVVLHAVVVAVAVGIGDQVRRMRALVSLLLLWPLLGNLAATLFASAGPVYFARVTGGPDPFLPLMQYLHAAADVVLVQAVQTQEILWRAYEHQKIVPGAGLSAMPSLHVATSFMFALIAFSYRRWLGWVMTAFFLCILLGSVHLAWHYAVDGYAGMLGAALVWIAVGRLFARPAVQRLFGIAADRPED